MKAIIKATGETVDVVFESSYVKDGVSLWTDGKEEREKAIKKFREVTCKMGVDISCDNCSSPCVIYKFKELLDKQ